MTEGSEPYERPPHLLALLEQAADLHRKDAISEAAVIYEQILKEAPEDPDALHLGGLIAHQRGYPAVALELVSRSLAIRPGYGPAHGTLGLALGCTGQHLAAQAEFHRAVILDPSQVEAWCNLVFAANLDPGISRDASRAMRQQFDRIHIKPLVDAAAPHTNDRNPKRKLVVGYIGNDFRRHSAASLCWPVISRHDTARFRVVLLDGSRAFDEVSGWFTGIPGVSRHAIRGASDEDVADLIRRKGVDVLVDLTGFAAGTRLKVMARRPAPVQIEGWAYLADTTMLSCFDGIFCDEATVPKGADEGFTERPIRLPSFIPYEPIVAMPDVAPPPVKRNGYVTFGYMGRPEKTNERVLGVWAEILARVPESRILFKHNRLDNEEFAFSVVNQLVARGIADYRIEVRGGSPIPEHAAQYADVDIALDPWPENGGVTTLEAAYMGVPTVTLPGDLMGARMGESINSGMGAWGLLAYTPYDYVKLAEKMAEVPEPYRKEWRAGLLASPAMQHERYTRAVEDAYRDLWQRWCREES